MQRKRLQHGSTSKVSFFISFIFLLSLTFSLHFLPICYALHFTICDCRVFGLSQRNVGLFCQDCVVFGFLSTHRRHIASSIAQKCMASFSNITMALSCCNWSYRWILPRGLVWQDGLSSALMKSAYTLGGSLQCTVLSTFPVTIDKN